MRITLLLLGLFFFSTVNAVDSSFTLTSPGLTSDKQIPIVYTCDGKNLSPELIWSNPPPGTVSYVLEFYSPDSVVGVYYNWMVYNIAPTVTMLREGASTDLPGDALNANNTAGDDIYRGPCPPDSGVHHYRFELFALNSELDLSGITDMDEMTRMINKHKIKSTSLTVLFNH
jgi:Raf kinase inhibitor-like YbhB/YbcL family protein